MTILDIRELSKSFQGITALDGVDMAIDPGELVGIVGPNGAGKTTLFDCLTDVVQADHGSILFGGDRIDGMATAAIAQRGLIRTFQLPNELSELTVEENVRLGATNHPGETARHSLLRTGSARRREADVARQADTVLEFLDLDHVQGSYARALSAGQRKLLELGRVLMADPSTLLLDEPFAGVNPTLQRRILDRIADLNDDGMTVIIIEHDIEALVEICDRLVVLHNGRVLANGKPADVLQRDDVVGAYLGESLTGD